MLSASFGLAFLAGLLSTLSPCVLPLLPIVLGAAVGEHRYGPVALAAGLALSFVAIGLFIATIGFSIGLDQAVFRKLAALLLIVVGLVMVVPQMSTAFAVAASRVGGWAESRFSSAPTAGLGGQFSLGLLLGAVWTPCVGPTLGAASVLAAQGKSLGQVALVMTLFGLGAAVPLLALGTLSREAMQSVRGRLLDAGRSGRLALGILLVATGFFILSGLDKWVEAQLVAMAPHWLTDLTTQY